MATATESGNLWQEFGERWNRFWFAPGDPLPLSVLRLGVGACLVLYLLIITPDVAVWMSANGIVSSELYRQMVLGDDPVNRVAYWSIFNLCQNTAQVQAAHYVLLAIAILFTAGVLTRVTSVLAFLAILQYVHRAPIITSQVEPLLTFLLMYLCLGPCGAAFSFDAWRKRPAERELALEPTWTATVSLRLIQVHLALFYLMMAAAKLQGDLWWRGEAMWTLMSATQSRLIDLSFMRNWGYFLNFWTQLHLIYELTFAALIWGRFTRPIMLWVGLVLWLMLLIATGYVNFALLMIVANLAFVPANTWRARLGMR
jgi:hypothetical protein